MSKPTEKKQLEKTQRKPLVHRPSDVLDSFTQYDSENSDWLHFDESISLQIHQLEEQNRQYIRPAAIFNRRSAR